VYIVLLGPPGAGKGTQAERIVRELGVAHLATGDLFREEAAAGTELGLQAKAYMDRGDLVPDTVTIGMLLGRLFAPDLAAGVMLDGFPRTLAQGEALDRALQGRGASICRVLHIAVPDEELLDRLSGRWLCRGCSAVYHERNSPPKVAGRCDNCGSELYQRDDDRRETAIRRLERQRPPEGLLAHYRAQGKLTSVDGARPVEAVGDDLIAALRPCLGQ